MKKEEPVDLEVSMLKSEIEQIPARLAYVYNRISKSDMLRIEDVLQAARCVSSSLRAIKKDAK